MTLNEVFKSALTLEREDMHRLVDSLTAVLEVGAAVPIPETQAKPAKTRVKRIKKQKPAEKVQTAQASPSFDGPQY